MGNALTDEALGEHVRRIKGDHHMRAVILFLILAVVALLVLFATGVLSLNQTQPAVAPQVSVNGAGVTASGGQAPAFDVETGSVTVGTRPANVTVPVPSVSVNSPSNGAAPAPATNAQ